MLLTENPPLIINLPSLHEYQAAIQNPQNCFEDTRLKSCTTETDQFGLPRVRSGGFALTYKLQNERQTWAVRCFHKSAPDREARYLEICKYLSVQSSPYLVKVDYLPKGILVKGISYPITLMEWVNGDTLEKFLFNNYTNSRVVGNLITEFQKLVSDLESRCIAHGDLSHRNIIIRNQKMLLVDYDGIFVPLLAGKPSSELGNINFQHPLRNEKDFGPTIDRFSSIAIFLALSLIKIAPHLWKEFSVGSEGLLFRREDLANPDQSQLFKRAEALPGMRDSIEHFRAICKSDLANTPTLAQFISNERTQLYQVAKRSVQAVTVATNSHIAATRLFDLLKKSGETITVIGKVQQVHSSETRNHLPYIILNFGDWKKKDCFTVVIWSEALALFEIVALDPLKYENQWVSVTGMITTYKNIPQIVISSPSEIEVLASEQDANLRLKSSISTVGASNDGLWHRHEPTQTRLSPSDNSDHKPLLEFTSAEDRGRISKLFGTSNSKQSPKEDSPQTQTSSEVHRSHQLQTPEKKNSNKPFEQAPKGAISTVTDTQNQGPLSVVNITGLQNSSKPSEQAPKVAISTVTDTQNQGPLPVVNIPGLQNSRKPNKNRWIVVVPILLASLLLLALSSLILPQSGGFSSFVTKTLYKISASTQAKPPPATQEMQIVPTSVDMNQTSIEPTKATSTPNVVITPTLGRILPGVKKPRMNTDANIRTGPGVNFDIIGVLKKNSVIDLVGYNDDNDNLWYKLVGEGWVSAKLVNDAPDGLRYVNSPLNPKVIAK